MRRLRLLAPLVAFLLLASGAAEATAPFTYAPGTNGFTTTPFTVLSTELGNGTGLANGSTATSSVGCTSGVCSQANTGNAIWASIWFSTGTAGFTPSAAGAQIPCWFLRSSDGGTTFELDVSNTAVPRAPDFVIPLYDSAYASGNLAFAQGGLVRLPAESWKIKCQNNSGVTLAASGNVIKIGPVEVQY